jgi:hypothetical protein
VLLVIACSVTSEFEDLSSKVFEDGGEIYCAHHVRYRNITIIRHVRHTWCTCTNTLCVVTLLQQTVDTTDRELETGFGRARLGFAFTACSLAALGFAANFARHC